MTYSSKAAAVTPPVAGKTEWKLAGNDYSTATFLTVPEAWKGSILRLEPAQGAADWYFCFSSDSSIVISETTESTVSANAVTAVGNVPRRVQLGEHADVDLSLLDDRQKTYLLLKCPSGATTDYITISRTSGRVQDT